MSNLPTYCLTLLKIPSKVAPVIEKLCRLSIRREGRWLRHTSCQLDKVINPINLGGLGKKRNETLLGSKPSGFGGSDWKSLDYGDDRLWKNILLPNWRPNTPGPLPKDLGMLFLFSKTGWMNMLSLCKLGNGKAAIAFWHDSYRVGVNQTTSEAQCRLAFICLSLTHQNLNHNVSFY